MGRYPLKAIFTLFALASFVLLAGCGNLSRSPMAPDETAAISGESKALAPAAKPAKKGGETATADTTTTVTSKTGPSSYDLVGNDGDIDPYANDVGGDVYP